MIRYLRKIEEKVVDRRQVRWRMSQVLNAKADRRQYVGALVEEVVRATLIEAQEQRNEVEHK